MVYEVKNYRNDEGMTITALEEVSETGIINLIRKAKFVGSAVIPLGKQMMPIHFEFPDGYTLSKCFDEFEAFATKTAEAEIEKLQDEQFKKNLQIPTNNGFKIV
jgi:hypothetical protein